MRERSYRELHGTIDRDAHHSFIFINPGIGVQFCVRFVLHFLQYFAALLRSFCLIIIAARRQTDEHQDEETKKKKEEDDSEPGAKRNGRAIHCRRCAWGSHINSLAAAIRSDADRVRERGKFVRRASDR